MKTPQQITRDRMDRALSGKANTARHFILFERPPGSKVWTQIMKNNGVPMRFSMPAMAEQFARRYAEERRTCVHILAVELPKKEDAHHYAVMIDGDTRWACAE